MNKQTLTLVAFAAVAASAHAQTVTAVGATAPIDLNLAGNTQVDKFTTLAADANPGNGGFPGNSPWASPVQSNIGGDATLTKVSNGTGGGPYSASASIYFGGFSSVVNNNGGTLAVNDTTVVPSVKTIILQIQFGEAWTYDLWNDAGAVLNYNGGTQNVQATFRSLLAQQFVGTVNMPSGVENLYNSLHAFQWDVSSVGVPITDFSIQFTGVQHAQLYGLQLDQSDAVYAQAVPEPASMTVLAFGALAAIARRRKKA